jgi:hypothetical protein
VSKQLDADEWRAVLRRLAEVLSPPQRQVTLIGGVAIALGYESARRTTTDADVIMQPDVAAEVLPAAKQIASEFQLPPDWLNKAAFDAGLLVPPKGQGRIVLETQSLVFDVPPAEHLLGMKLVRWAGETDIEDASILLKKLRVAYSDVEDVWSLVGGFVLMAKRAEARHNLDVLWEMLDESA